MTEPDSPLPDKGLGGRQEPQSAGRKGKSRPLPQATRRTARPSFRSGQMSQAASSAVSVFLPPDSPANSDRYHSSTPQRTQGWVGPNPFCLSCPLKPLSKEQVAWGTDTQATRPSALLFSVSWGWERPLWDAFQALGVKSQPGGSSLSLFLLQALPGTQPWRGRDPKFCFPRKLRWCSPGNTDGP